MLKRSAILLLSFSVCAAEKAERDPAEVFTSEIQPILAKHCYECHGQEKQKADLNLALFDSIEAVHNAPPEIWKNAFERVFAFEMPPEGKGELNFENQHRLVDWLRDLKPKEDKTDCDQIASDRNASFYRGFAMSRRLNRAEYANTIRDLFGVPIDISEMLPADGGGGEGFDTTGNALFTSSIHIEKYLAAADRIVSSLVPDSHGGLAPEFAQARRAILLGRPNPAHAQAREQARAVLGRIVPLAYRRPATGEDIERPLSMFDRAWNRGDGYLPAVRLALKSVLISPHFLFLLEPEPPEKGVQPLPPFALASRLSYFLWSSMPDRELMAAAEDGTLQQGDVLRGQVRRMLADPKAQALGRRFALQWLDLERLGTEVKPDPTKFPEFTPELQQAMLAEVTGLFNYIFQADRPLTDLIAADYSFLNERLARIYGIPNVDGPAIRKVHLPGDRRGGITGMAAVHTLTSFPLRTSPVLRGRWVLEALLGEKINPPPPDTPALEESAQPGKNLSLREQLQIHRAKPECASCHNKMDPLGFGMENFGVLGQWRESDRGQPIDSSGKLSGGESFTGPSGLKKILLSRKEDVMRHLVRKMTGYAYGRELNRFDDCVVDKAMDALKSSDYRAGVLVEHIALSFPFRHRFYPKIETASLETNP